MSAEIQGWLQQAVAAFGRGDFMACVKLCTQVTEQSPEHHGAWHLAGAATATAGDFERSIGFYEQAIALNGEVADYHNNLGIAFRELKQSAKAVESYRRAIALAPDVASHYSNLGDALVQLEVWEEARGAFELALKRDPSSLDARFNLANLLRDLGELDRAEALYRELLQVLSRDPDVHWNLGLTQLLANNYSDGFKSYAWREKLPSAPPIEPVVGAKRWQGQALENCTICLIAEQGFGDCLQMVRFSHTLASKGARVVLRVPARLVALLSHAKGVSKVYSEAEVIEGCDYWAPMMSVPEVLNMELDDVRFEEPYLNPPRQELVAIEDELLAMEGLKVALNWQGDPSFTNDRYRSLSLDYLLPLLTLPGVSFCSVQKGHGEEALPALPAAAGILALGPKLDLGQAGFLETAELLRRLDLLVTSDTAVAHLAGALGVDVWLMLSRRPDWRWGTRRNQSIWYPSIRIFRQDELGAWERLVAELTAELGKRAALR